MFSRLNHSPTRQFFRIDFATSLLVVFVVFFTTTQLFGQDNLLESPTVATATNPAEWPWAAWQRSSDSVDRWKELDTGETEAWRQRTFDFDGSPRGSVFFVLAPAEPSTPNERSLSPIEIPRMDNVVERVWWWPLNDEQAATPEPKAKLPGDAYRMPFVPPPERLMKLTQSPTRWTLSFQDPAAAGRAMLNGGFIVMDVRGNPHSSAAPQRIQAGKDGVIVMPASQAKVFGKRLQFEPLPHKNTVGFWVDGNDHAAWKITVPTSGDYDVHLLQGCGAGQGGSRIALKIGDVVVETTVVETGHFQNFRGRDLGTVKLKASDDIDVSLRCLNKAKAAVMDVRQIRLIPAAVKMPSDEREVATDVDLPPLTHESPMPGRRSIRQTSPIEGSKAYHLLTLPTDWVASRRYPVLVEWTGNGPFENDRGDRSSGRVEDARLAYGISGGDGQIVLSLPFVNDAGTANVTKWWGDSPTYRPDSTIAYARSAIDEVCEKFGGDRSKLVLVGFSRGAIACNAVGLANDDVASWWSGFICFSHYDGIHRWPPTGDEAESLRRLARLGDRPQLIMSESVDGVGVSDAQQTMQYLNRHSIPTANLQSIETGFFNHSDGWSLRPCPARTEAREWLRHRMEK